MVEANIGLKLLRFSFRQRAATHILHDPIWTKENRNYIYIDQRFETAQSNAENSVENKLASFVTQTFFC